MVTTNAVCQPRCLFSSTANKIVQAVVVTQMSASMSTSSLTISCLEHNLKTLKLESAVSKNDNCNWLCFKLSPFVTMFLLLYWQGTAIVEHAVLWQFLFFLELTFYAITLDSIWYLYSGKRWVSFLVFLLLIGLIMIGFLSSPFPHQLPGYLHHW